MIYINTREVVTDIKRYIFGGWSRFSILQYNNDGGIIQQDYEIKYSNRNRSMYFVYTRDLREGRMCYHGYITDYSNGLSYNKAKTLKLKSLEDYNEKAIKGLMWVLNHANCLPEQVKIINDGTCAKCGRPLLEEDIDGCGFCYECRRKFSK